MKKPLGVGFRMWTTKTNHSDSWVDIIVAVILGTIIALIPLRYYYTVTKPIEDKIIDEYKNSFRK